MNQTTNFGVALLCALIVHVVALVAVTYSISFQLKEPDVVEPRIIAVALPPPPPPSLEAPGAVDALAMIPRFRPREPIGVNQEQRKRFGDPALAVWKYLCNRDETLSDTVRKECPEFNWGNVNLGVGDPLNRQGDSGFIVGNETSTMSLDEVGRKKGWIKPKPPWPGDGARAQGSDLGLPGHDPFAILPGHGGSGPEAKRD